MKTTTHILTFVSIGMLLGSFGCSTSPKSDSAAFDPALKPAPQIPAGASRAKSDSASLQGTWKGKELGANTEDPCYLIVTGKDFHFRGADTNEWYKGTFSLREDANPKQFLGAVTECCDPKFVGKTSYAIYRIEDGTLTLTANEPGNPDVPSSFDASDARRFVFTAK